MNDTTGRSGIAKRVEPIGTIFKADAEVANCPFCGVQSAAAWTDSGDLNTAEPAVMGCDHFLLFKALPDGTLHNAQAWFRGPVADLG